ncbi:MAG: hypothetical protein LBI58_04795 [Tannerellaceae bacterium]|nr:hypothetical protein [Tannerellaceae bacterium]
MDGDDSHGGYVKGTLYLKENQEIYIRVSKGGTGGATDFRLVDGVWSLPKGLNSRIMVAGGGGGDEAGYGTAGDAGGLVGYGGEGGEGGTQTGGGDSFGCGGGTLSSPGGDGGDGYYGGDGGDNGSAGGGSSFISGMTGCIAIDPTNYGFPRAQDKIGYDASLNYSDAEFFTSPTWPDGAEILFTNVSMIDGSGYEWNTGVKGAIPVGLPARGGIYARITRIIVNP